MPSASILIPAFNAEATILRALECAQAQTFDDIEIIVIDDASTDTTADQVKSRAVSDPRIQLLRLEKNSGPAAARNVGIAIAKGEWLALLDADDTMSSDRLERLIAMSDSSDVLVADNLELYDRHAGRTVKLGIDPTLLGAGLRLDARGFAARCKTNQSDALDFGLLKPLVRAAHIQMHSVTYDEQMRYGEDFRFYLDVLLAGGTLLVHPQAYYQYTERVGSISKVKSGLSKTIVRFDRLEAHTRGLAQEPRYTRVASELRQRADALRKQSKVISFRECSALCKVIMLPVTLADQDMRSHILSRVQSRVENLRSSEWRNSTLFRDSSNLCLGQGIKLALQGVYFLCIARSLGPAQYGAFVAVTAMTSIVSPYVGLGSGNLFLKNVRSGKRNAQLCWGNGLLATAISGLLTTVALCGFSHLWSSGIPLALIAAICISDLISTRIIDLVSFGFAASGKMSKTAIQNTTMSVLRVIGILFLICFYRHVTVALWAWTYLITAIAGSLFALQQGGSLWGWPRFSVGALWDDTREGAFFSISTSAQTIYNDIDKTMLARLSTLSATGVYAAAYRIIDTSLTPVRSLVSAAYPAFFRIGADGMEASYGYAKRLIHKAVIFGIVDFFGLVLIAPFLPIILGPRYAGVAPAIQWLALIPVLRCVHWFLADALSGANAQILRTGIQVGVALLNIGLNLIVLPRWSWVGAAWTSLASDGALLAAVYFAVQWKLSAGTIREVAHATE